MKKTKLDALQYLLFTAIDIEMISHPKLSISVQSKKVGEPDKADQMKDGYRQAIP